MKFMVGIFICIFAASLCLFLFIEKSNQLTELRIAIPLLAKKVRELKEENNYLQYEIDQYENPSFLMELARKPEFEYLKFPYVRDEIFLEKPCPQWELAHE